MPTRSRGTAPVVGGSMADPNGPGLRTQLTQLLRQNPNAQLPEGWYADRAGDGQVYAAQRTSGDWLNRYAPLIIGSLAGYGVATSPALAGSLGGQMAANAGIQAGLTGAQGGSLRDVALAGASGAAGGATGGSGMGWADILKDPNTWSAIASVAGNAAGQKSDQRMQQTQATNQSNLADLALYSAAQNAQNQAGQLDLNRKGFTEQARGGRAKQALLADLISNIKDVSINVPGVTTANVQGGLRPSALGGTGRQSMAELAKQALQAQLAGDTFTGGEILPTPEYRPMPERGGVETALDWIGLLGSGAGALGSVLNRTQQPTTYSQLPQTAQNGAIQQNLREALQGVRF